MYPDDCARIEEVLVLVVAAAPFSPSLRYLKEGNENNLKSVTYVAEHLPPKRELLIKKNSIYLYYFGFYPFSGTLAVLISSVTTSCVVYLATFLVAKLRS